ncbi:MAG: tRNA lysidine(34) synthetase TilS, partial [Betaproteobacteria bacterium]|nr:tRNA lysidine(34) synthetase TilS [Betaproteobacteria bacterium]
MASSRKSKSNNLSGTIENVLRGQVRPGSHLVVALSGGVDSVVLLDVLVPLSTRLSFSLSAIHINHGISTNATKWGAFCRDLCRSSGISLKIAKLKIRREPGVSLEAAARDERYRVFGKLKADYVVLAQHLDDQAETLLLQLLRGAGVKGLGAMPAVRNPASDIGERAGAGIAEKTAEKLPERKPDEGPKILRPMLEVSRREIEDYAGEHDLQWITDESNVDVSFDRNFLRHQIFPLLETRFPSYRNTLLRASRHMAEASTLLDELAEADGKGCAASGRLHIDELRKLSIPRARNLLRYTLVQQGAILPSAAKLDEMLKQLLSSRSDAKLHVVFGNAEIRRFRGEVYVRKANRNDAGKTGAAAAIEAWPQWRGEKQFAVDELGGIIRFDRRKSTGINLQKLTESPVTVRLRRGGERLRPDCNRPRRSLKNLLREASLPPWERESLPLIFSGERLACVPGIGVECDFQAAPGEQGLVVSWQRDG